MQISKLLVVFIFEFTIAILVVTSVLGFLYFRLRGRIKTALTSVLSTIEAHKQQREADLKQTLVDQFKLETADAESAASCILNNELKLFVHFANVMKEGGDYHAQKFCQAYAAVVEGYENIERSDREGSERVVPVVDEDSAKLMEQNVVLTAELAKSRDQMRISLETLDAMITEYSMAFDKESGVELLKASQARVVKVLASLTDEVDASPDGGGEASVAAAAVQESTADVDNSSDEPPQSVVESELDADETVVLDVAAAMNIDVEDDSFLDVSNDDVDALLAGEDDLFQSIAGESSG